MAHFVPFLGVFSILLAAFLLRVTAARSVGELSGGVLGFRFW